MSLHPARRTTQVRPRPEGGGDFAPARGGGSGANRAAGGPEEKDLRAARLDAMHPVAPHLIRGPAPFAARPRRGGRGGGEAA